MRIMACGAHPLVYRRVLGLRPVLPLDAVGVASAAYLLHRRFQEFGLS